MSEARRRTVTWQDPRAATEAGTAMAGIDYLRAMIAGELPQAPMAETLGFRLTEVADGFAVFTSTAEEHHYNPLSTVHGGLAAALIDSATGCAVHTTLPAGTLYTTINLSVDFLRPATADTGVLRCEGRIVHRGARLAIAEGRVIGGDGDKVLARGQTTCMIFDA